MADFGEAPFIDNQATGADKLGLCERFLEVLIVLDIKVFSKTGLHRHVCHTLSKAKHFDLDLKTIVDHDIELANLTNYIDYVCVEVLVYDRLVQLEAIIDVPDDNPAQLVPHVIHRDESVLGNPDNFSGLMQSFALALKLLVSVNVD